MSTKPLTDEDRTLLLQFARQTLEQRTAGKPVPKPNAGTLSERLRQAGASFVTLTQDGELRGCVGALEAYQPLFADVIEHAEAAAFEDFRFQPLRSTEVPRVKIEISVLTAPEKLEYTTPEELLASLRPGVDGVLIRDGMRRATFLPQVWEQLPDRAAFMEHLCSKMGAPEDLWRHRPLQVSTYQVECFEEK